MHGEGTAASGGGFGVVEQTFEAQGALSLPVFGWGPAQGLFLAKQE